MRNDRAIVLIGQGRWVKSLAEGLAEADLVTDIAPLDSVRQALSPAMWRRVARAAVVVRIGFRPGARTWRGLAFDMALRLFVNRRARTCCYWIGTDVMHFAEDMRSGTHGWAWRSPAFAVDRHIAGSEPLRRELAEAGIGASVAPFPWRTVNAPTSLPEFPKTFTAVTYVPDARGEFYGGALILDAARRMPGVRFEVMGGTGSWAVDAPSNVVFLGWVSEPAEVYARSSCVLRLTEHDSIGGTAVEGLLFGRPVIYTQELDYAERVHATSEAVVDALERLLEQHERGALQLGERAARWAREEFDPVRRFAGLAATLTKLGRDDSPRQPRLTYLTLQATTEGQAAHAHVHEIVKGLASCGWSVRLLAPDYGGRHPNILGRLAQFIRIEFSALLGLRSGSAFYIRSHFAAWPAASVAHLLRIPVIQEVNGPHVDAILAWPALERVRGIVEWLDRSQMRMANAVITVTPQLVKWIAKDAGVSDVHLVSNGADVERFRPGLAAPADLPARFAVFFGALAPWQGIGACIEATRSGAWPRDVTLVVVGDGMLRDEVELAADGGRVMYLGQRPYGEIASIVGNSIASLIPMDARDRSESGLAPLKLFESMACGVPVIASDLPGLAETVSLAGCGILVEPGSPDAIARAIALLAGDPATAKAMGARGRASAVNEHSWRSRAEDTDRILRSIIEGGSRRA